MHKINRLLLLTHPMAYHGLGDAAWARPWVKFEREMAQRWLDAMKALPSDAAVVIVSGYPLGPPAMEAFCAQAESTLGERCFTLREPDYRHRDFWKRVVGEEATRCLHDVRDAILAQGDSWNKEELDTLFHTRSCAIGLLGAMRKRRMTFDAATVSCEGWGEEFEGCTTKYILAFQRALGLGRPVELVFDMCVPGAKFVLNPRGVERVAIGDGLRLFLFDTARGPIGLFTSTHNTVADKAENVRLPTALQKAIVRSKQGRRLWPAAKAHLKNAPLGVDEHPQAVVHRGKSGLSVPVCTGVVYRLAKSPAYIFAPRGMTMSRFRSLMIRATRA
jgi:hypothetical protein